jgi:hypothetical protein
MGLFRDVFGMVQQSQQSDRDYELKKRAYEDQMSRYNEENRQRTEAWAGLTALQEIKKSMSDAQRKKDYYESILPATMASDPEKGFSVSEELKKSKDSVDYFKDLEQIKKAQTYFELVNTSKAPAMTAQFVGQMLGMKNPKAPEDSDYVQMEQKTVDEVTGATTTKKWRERQQANSDSSDSSYAIGSQGSSSQASMSNMMQQGFNDYQTGSMPNISQGGYSSGYGNASNSNYLAGSGGFGSYMNARPAPQQSSRPVEAQEQAPIPQFSQEPMQSSPYSDVNSFLKSKGISASQPSNTAATGGGRNARTFEDIVNESRSRLSDIDNQLNTIASQRNSRGNLNTPAMEGLLAKRTEEEKNLNRLIGGVVTPNAGAQPQADIEKVRQDALQAINTAKTPQARQEIRDRAAKMGIILP